MFNIINSF